MINKKIIHRKFFRFFFRDPVPGLYTTLGLTQVDNSSAMSKKNQVTFTVLSIFHNPPPFRFFDIIYGHFIRFH